MKTKLIILLCIIGTNLMLIVPVYADPGISLWGPSLNDGFTITDSNKIIFGFEHDPTSPDISEIDMILPIIGCSFTVEKDSGSCSVGSAPGCSGSLVTVPTLDSGSLTAEYISGPTGISQFDIEVIAPVSPGTGGWDLAPLTNANIIYARAIPDITITYPAEVLSGSPVIVTLDASATAPVYSGLIAPLPSIASYSWTQIGTPSVGVTGDTSSAPTFTIPTVAVDTDLVFELTVTDNIGVTAIDTVTVTVLTKQDPIDVVLAMDTSGSMGWHRSGSLNDLDGGCCSRLASAKLAAKYFVDRLGTFAEDSRLGVAIFPAEPAPGTNYGDRYTPAADLADSTMFDAIKIDIGGEDIVCSDCTTIPVAAGAPTGIPVNWNWTPTQYGLDAARTMLTTVPGAAGRSQIIVLLSDGAWNLGTDPADPTYLSGFVADGIKIYTIGMGTGADNVNHTSLQDISTSTNIGGAGDPFGFTTYNFGDVASEPNLLPYLEKIMSHMNTLDFSVDPPDSIKPGEVKKHKALVTSHDSLLSFTLSWESSLKELLYLYVIAPDGTRLKPKYAGNGYLNITVEGKLLENPKNVGTWIIEVKNPSKEKEIIYNYSVMIKSSLNMKILLDKEKYNTSDYMLLEARLIEDNKRLKGAEVIAEVKRPETGIGNWHYKHIVPMSQILEVPDNISGEPLSLLDRKNLILLQKEQVELPPIITVPKIIFNDEGIDGDKYRNDGIYTGLFKGFDVPGIYKFKVTANGVTEKEQKFHREQEVQKYVDMAADKELTVKEGDIQINIKEKTAIMTIRVIPFDKRKNFLGPGYADKILIKSSEGKPIIDREKRKEKIVVTDLLDGTYQQQFLLDDIYADPDITIVVRGVVVYKGPFSELKDPRQYK